MGSLWMWGHGCGDWGKIFLGLWVLLLPTLWISSAPYFFSQKYPCPNSIFQIGLLVIFGFFWILKSGMLFFHKFFILSFLIHKIKANKNTKQK